jgi:hypothetical protein
MTRDRMCIFEFKKLTISHNFNMHESITFESEAHQWVSGPGEIETDLVEI